MVCLHYLSFLIQLPFFKSTLFLFLRSGSQFFISRSWASCIFIFQLQVLKQGYHRPHLLIVMVIRHGFWFFRFVSWVSDVLRWFWWCRSICSFIVQEVSGSPVRKCRMCCHYMQFPMEVSFWQLSNLWRYTQCFLNLGVCDPSGAVWVFGLFFIHFGLFEVFFENVYYELWKRFVKAVR